MTGNNSNNQNKKTGNKKSKKPTTKNNQPQAKKGAYQKFINNAPIASPIVPSDIPLWTQLTKVKLELRAYCGNHKHLEPILHVLEGKPQK